MDPNTINMLVRSVLNGALSTLRNPTLAASAVAVFLAGYCDDHGIDRGVVVRIIQGQAKKPIDVQ